MVKGSLVKCLIDYDLFGLNIKGKEGCYIKTDEHTRKSLIWFPCNGEWAELQEQEFEQVESTQLSVMCKDLAARIETMRCTY